MLAIHKDIQQKTIDEIDLICGAESELKFNNEFLEKFKYLNFVIKESLRMFQAAPVIGRETSEEVEICGYTIPKDTTIIMSVFGMQRDPKYWGNDAHLFKPERFDNFENSQAWKPFTGELLTLPKILIKNKKKNS